MDKKLSLGRMAKERLEEIKYLFKVGEITHKEACEQAKSPLEQLNCEMKKISNEHGFKHRNITFARFMR